MVWLIIGTLIAGSLIALTMLVLPFVVAAAIFKVLWEAIKLFAGLLLILAAVVVAVI